MKKIFSLLRKKLVKETIWSALGKGTGLIFFVLINVVLARRFGKSEFGEWSFFFSILTIFLMFSNLGLNNSSKKFIASYNHTDKLNQVLAESLRLRHHVSLIYSLVLLSVFLIVYLITEQRFMLYLTLSTPLVLFYGNTEYYKSVFEGLHRLKNNFILNLTDFGLRFFLLLAFTGTVISISQIITIFSIGYFATAIMGLLLVKRKFPKLKESKGMRKKIIRYSWPFLIISIGIYVSTELDTVMLGVLSSKDQVAIYSVVKNLMSKTVHIATIIGLGTMPVFAKITSENVVSLKKLFNKLLFLGLVIYGCIVVTVLLFAKQIIFALYGSEYKEAIPVLQILTIFISYSSVTVFLSSLLDYQGKAKKRALNLYICTALNILLNLFLIPKYGAIGSAIGTSIAYLPYIILNWIEVKAVFRSISNQSNNKTIL